MPSRRAASTTFATWSGRERAFPIRLCLAVRTFVRSVPALKRLARTETSTESGVSTGVATSTTSRLPSPMRWRTCFMWMSVRAAAGEHCRQSPQDEPYVGPQRPIRDVKVVELHHLVEGDVRPAEDLPRAGDAGHEIEPAAPPAVDLTVLVLDQRPRTHKAHIALQDVHQLRQLVEAALPKQSPNPRNPGVLVEEQPGRILALAHEQLGLCVRADSHRPELQQLEAAVTLPHTQLAVEHRPLRVDLDCKRD